MCTDPVLLFDIDGTLLEKSISGPTIKQQAFAQAMNDICGIPDVDYFDFPIDGATDPGIPRIALRHYNWSNDRIERVMEPFFKRYFECFDALLKVNSKPEYTLLPGVTEFLDHVKDLRPGLATGNMERFARYKLAATGIEHLFSFGGFGDDAVEREGIVMAAIKKAGLTNPENAIVFGDTPRDISAGIAAGCRVCAVATGHFSVNDLQPLCRNIDRVIARFDSVSFDSLLLWINCP